jgi:hypothetical protein
MQKGKVPENTLLQDCHSLEPTGFSPMIILSEYELIYNNKDDFYAISPKSEQMAACPECSHSLKYRDSRLRIRKVHGGGSDQLLIRRLKCSHCKRLHTELPDVLAPYKHYTTEVIEDVVDAVIDSDDLETEAYPCEATMHRWNAWLFYNQLRIDGLLKSVGYRRLGFSEVFLKSGLSLLAGIRETGAGWLGTILRVIYNAGNFLPA